MPFKFNPFTGTLDIVNAATGVGSTITGATQGSVLFAGVAGVLAQDNANFFFDDTNNRLGIGTTSPSTPLHVTTASLNLTTATFSNTTPTGDALVKDYVVKILSTNGNSNASNFGLYIECAGASSNSALRVVGASSFFGNITMNAYSISGLGNLYMGGVHSSAYGTLFLNDTTSSYLAGNGGNIVFAGDDVGQGVGGTVFGNIRGIKENSSYFNSLGALVFGTQSNSGGQQTLPTVTEKMRITSGGNVGIGTISPASLLEVGTYNTSKYNIKTGSFLIQPYGLNNGFLFENAYFNGAQWTRLNTGYAAGFQFYNGQFLVNTGGTGSGNFTPLTSFKVDSANSGTVALGGSIDYVEGSYTGAKMVVLGTGNVGIGTVTPSDKLSVYTAKTSISTTTPDSINLGGTYSNTPATNLKLKLYDDGTNIGGLGISFGQVDYKVWTTAADHVFYQATTELMRINGSGNVGIGQTVPTASLHIKAGTATANTAPLKLTSGTHLTTAETGAIEYNGTNLFFTRSGTTREGVVTQSAVTTEVLVSDTSVSVNIDGVTYKLLARA